MTEEDRHQLAGTIFENAIKQMEDDFFHRWESNLPYLALGQDMYDAMRIIKKGQVPNLSNYTNLSQAMKETRLKEIREFAIKIMQMGVDFKIIVDAITDDPFLMSEWERFMLSLKMREETK
jgi:hypothetical protein